MQPGLTATGTHVPYGMMGSHIVTCYLAEVTFPPLPQTKLVLDLATQKGCKAEFTNWTSAVELRFFVMGS